jgi:hypothetical protein
MKLSVEDANDKRKASNVTLDGKNSEKNLAILFAFLFDCCQG